MTLSMLTALMFLALAMLDSIAAAVAVPAYDGPPRLDQHNQRNTPSLIVRKQIRE
jgi:hypothetical protein